MDTMFIFKLSFNHHLTCKVFVSDCFLYCFAPAENFLNVAGK